jgi:hypothetical protein
MKRPFLNVLILLTLAGPRFAHSQSILINEPVEWREGRAVIVVAGKPLRIAGSVTHPAGVAKLFINGREVAIRQDKMYPDYYEFEKILPSDSVTAVLTIRITSVSGQSFEQKYPATLPGGPIVKPPVVVPVVGPVVGPVAPTVTRRSDWGPFKKRGIVYGAAMIGGAVMFTMNKTERAVVCSTTARGSDCVDRKTTSKPYEGAGGALLGGAAFVTIVDALLTSRRASHSLASVAVPGGARLSLDVPALAPSSRGTAFQVLRIGVH